MSLCLLFFPLLWSEILLMWQQHLLFLFPDCRGWIVHLSVHDWCWQAGFGVTFFLCPTRAMSCVGCAVQWALGWRGLPAGLDTPYENLSGHWCVPLAFIPGIPWLQLKKSPWCIQDDLAICQKLSPPLPLQTDAWGSKMFPQAFRFWFSWKKVEWDWLLSWVVSSAWPEAG